MTCWMLEVCRIFIEVFYLLLVDCNRQDLLFLEFIWMCFVPFHDHQPMIFMQLDLTGRQEDLWEEILFFEDFFIIRFLQNLITVL